MRQVITGSYGRKTGSAKICAKGRKAQARWAFFSQPPLQDNPYAPDRAAKSDRRSSQDILNGLHQRPDIIGFRDHGLETVVFE